MNDLLLILEVTLKLAIMFAPVIVVLGIFLYCNRESRHRE